MSRFTPPPAAALLAVLLLLPGPAIAAGEEAAAAAKAKEARRKLGDYFAALAGFKVEVKTTQTVQQGALKREMTQTSVFSAKRPNLLSVKMTVSTAQGSDQAAFVSDGKQMQSYVKSLNKYVVEPAPASLDKLLAGGLLARIISPGDAMLLAVFSKTEESKEPAEYAGEEEVGGARCHHLRLAMKGSAARLDVWFETGEKPLFRRVQVTEKRGGASLKVVSTYSNWAPGAEIAPAAFAFSPPAGARKVKSFFERPPHPVLGRAAPDFELELAGGGKVKLSDHKGKNIVILDFWATWCGPCRRALPVISEVAAAYKDKGVVFYAVNQRESAEKARAFLDGQKLKVAAALDKDGRVGGLYGVRGIPQTVIVARDGSVQAVHVGVAPDLKSRLTKELDALLAGKKLAAEEQEEAVE